MNEGGSDLDLEAMLAAAEALDNAGGEEAEYEVNSANNQGDARPGEADGKSEGTGDGTDAGEGSDAGESDDTKEESSQTGGEEGGEGEGEDSAADTEKGKKDSKYQRAKKSEERLGKTWAEVNAEKQRIAEEKAQLEREKAELARLKEEGARKPQAQRTAEDYEAAAEEFEKDGDTELANAARQQAAQVRQAQERATWAQEAEAFVNAPANAELRNLESPLSKEVQKLLREGPYLQLKGGFARAVEDARVRLDAGSLPSLKSENAKLKAELEKANRRLGLTGSQPAPAAQVKKTPAAGDLLAAARALDEQGIAVAS